MLTKVLSAETSVEFSYAQPKHDFYSQQTDKEDHDEVAR